MRENWCKCILIASSILKQIANIKKKHQTSRETISCRSNGITPTCHPPCYPPHCANTPDKMTFDSNNTQTVLLFWHAAQAGRDTAAARMGAIELAAHYQSNLSSSSITTEAAFSICSALFTDASAEKTTTIWWQPDWLPIDTVLIFALVLLYVLKKMMEWISSTRQHTQTGTNTPVSCLFLCSLPSQCIFRIKPISPHAKPSPARYWWPLLLSLSTVYSAHIHCVCLCAEMQLDETGWHGRARRHQSSCAIWGVNMCSKSHELFRFFSGCKSLYFRFLLMRRLTKCRDTKLITHKLIFSDWKPLKRRNVAS